MLGLQKLRRGATVGLPSSLRLLLIEWECLERAREAIPGFDDGGAVGERAAGEKSRCGVARCGRRIREGCGQYVQLWHAVRRG